MTKEQRIRMHIARLNREKIKLMKLVREQDHLIEEQFELYRKLYSEFFENKTSVDFVLYDKFPSFQEVQAYYSKLPIPNHPLVEYGEFDIKELAEVIKLLYSYQRQREYQIITLGFLGWNLSTNLFEPHILFLIGDDETLKEYQSYQGKFLERKRYFNFLEKKNFICLEADRIVQGVGSFPIEHMLKIQTDLTSVCTMGLDTEVRYYDRIKGCYRTDVFSKYTNIMKKNVTDDFVHYQGIKDTLSFPIHIKDSFIAKALLSIAIYKKNNNKIMLFNEDYQYIFYEMFGETVDIEKEVEKGIPRTLKYDNTTAR